MAFYIGDKVVLNGCPFDEQIMEDLLQYIDLKNRVMTITKVKKVTEHGTSGQWIQTNLLKEWIDGSWLNPKSRGRRGRG